ncbi:MAG: nitroreductase family protein [Muribaculaceae bacterium]|nr:nitroreductase family protein [Muribaculaceae bacterium]
MVSFDEIRELLAENRSYRRFDAGRPVEREMLEELVGLTRFCASGRNLQPLRYRIVNTKEECEAFYPLLKWAGYYTDWDGPEAEERPTAYLVQCLDTELTGNCMCDDGLQLEAITLGAVSRGLRGVIIKSFNVPETTKLLEIPERYKPLYVLALGYPCAKEHILITDTDGSTNADIRYYHDAEGNHVVPKRPLKELIIGY